MHGDNWSGDLVKDALIDAFVGLAVWSPATDEIEPIGPNGVKIQLATLIVATSHVLGRSSETRARLLKYASRAAQSRSMGGACMSVADYCRSIGWSASSFRRACDDVASHLNARDRERRGCV